MNYHNVRFAAAYGTAEQLPPSCRTEVCFTGRSNVGKSSLLNRLFNRRHLAKVSSRPGKTSTINFFEADAADFVDLPGYGYAQVSKAEKARWAAMIEGYFRQDRDVALVVSLVDVRHPATALDEQMVSFLQEVGLPFIIAQTKADKLGKSQVSRSTAALRSQLALPEQVAVVAVSSEKGTGIDELKRLIDQHIES